MTSGPKVCNWSEFKSSGSSLLWLRVFTAFVKCRFSYSHKVQPLGLNVRNSCGLENTGGISLSEHFYRFLLSFQKSSQLRFDPKFEIRSRSWIWNTEMEKNTLPTINSNLSMKYSWASCALWQFEPTSFYYNDEESASVHTCFTYHTFYLALQYNELIRI